MVLEGISKQNYIRYNNMIDNFFSRAVNKKIVVFGAGVMGQQFMSLLYIRGVRNAVFCDNNSDLWNTRIMDSNVIPIDVLRDINEFEIYIAIENYEKIEHQLRV